MVRFDGLLVQGLTSWLGQVDGVLPLPVQAPSGKLQFDELFLLTSDFKSRWAKPAALSAWPILWQDLWTCHRIQDTSVASSQFEPVQRDEASKVVNCR